MAPTKPTAIDLFCGAGGLSLGLLEAGFRVIWAADKMDCAVRTYRLNVGDHVHQVELAWDTSVPGADVITGGPPCQGFSSAGRRAPGDARNTLVAVFAHIVALHKPRAFLFENVEGFLTGERGRWVIDLLDPLIRAGYCIHLRKINAANYGVPQHRKRVVALGGLGWDPGFPDPTHSANGAPGASKVASHLPLCPSVQDALKGLPLATEGRHSTNPSDHWYKKPNGTDLARIQALRQGQTMRDLPESLWHDTYRRRAYRRVMDGTPTERRGGAPAGLRRLIADQPSKAITSGARSEFVHPLEDRNLTLRECARLQTFPDSFTFEGTLSQRSLLIGNAIPPTLAAAFAAHLRDGLRKADTREREPGLLSFVPTHAEGMSPALQRTTTMIEERYRSSRQFQMPLFAVRKESVMSLTQAQRSLIEKARNVGSSDMAVPLGDAECAYLVGTIAHDLNLANEFPEIPKALPPFFETWPVSELRLTDVNFEEIAERLFSKERNADTYFSCLAALLKARLKYEQILKRQPLPTFEQVGPRGLLQYGSFSPRALAALLFWRKWIYDLDNRAAQETGYLFEPILAAAIGGTPVSARRSPVKRIENANKGRQIDCIRGKLAYEFKLRVTIAASGQGRWGEELSFPRDCVQSGYVPVLVVLDPTENAKLSELQDAFLAAGGQTYVGDAAWKHLEAQAGPSMSVFLERYVRIPLDALMNEAPEQLPRLILVAEGDKIRIVVGDEEMSIHREPTEGQEDEAELPDDVADSIGGA